MVSLRNFRIILRARWALRGGIVVSCDRCMEMSGYKHRPCFAVYCGCPCSRMTASAVTPPRKGDSLPSERQLDTADAVSQEH